MKSEAYKRIEKKYSGLFGFVVVEAIDDGYNSYEDIGKYLKRVVDENPDQFELIEKVIIAISGIDFKEIEKQMEERADYYDSL